MRDLTQHLSTYAAYHRDRRNIATHFVGVPMIVLGIVTLLARPSFAVAGVALSPAWIATAAAIGFYVTLDRRYGIAMAVLTGLASWAGSALASGSTGLWLGSGLGLFSVGWVIQFVGHFYEGRKPAFVNDLIGLVVGPLFVVAEAGFALGLRTPLREEIERRVGPTGIRAPGAPALSTLAP